MDTMSNDSEQKVLSWQPFPAPPDREVLDIGVGAWGGVWIVAARPRDTNGQVYRRVGEGWDLIGAPPSSPPRAPDILATRIAVAPDNQAWVIGSVPGSPDFPRIYVQNAVLNYAIPFPPPTGFPPLQAQNGAFFDVLPPVSTVAALDIGVGANGTAWVIMQLAQLWVWNGQDWYVRVYGESPMRVAAEPNGTPWAILEGGRVGRWDGGAPGWTHVTGPIAPAPAAMYPAVDIGVAADGEAWVADTQGQIFFWKNGAWNRASGPPFLGVANPIRAIDVGPEGLPWVVDRFGRIWKSFY